MGRFISLMIFLVEYLLVVDILILSAMAHGSELEAAAPNVQQQQLNIFNRRRIGFELEEEKQGILPIIADAPAGSSTPEPSETTTTAEGPADIRRMGKEHRHHHSSDKSPEAGGGLIIGGLATAIFAAVFCYIRVTRKRSSTDHHIGSSSSTITVRESTRMDGTTSAAASSSSTK